MKWKAKWSNAHNLKDNWRNKSSHWCFCQVDDWIYDKVTEQVTSST